MSKKTILIIEDEVDLLELIEYNLQKKFYETIGFLSTKGVKRCLKEESVDLMIVDRNLPNVEGSEFIQELRNEGMDIPVIFLSAKDSDAQIEEGFLRGGDDYMAKPFNMNELILRIGAILKRLAQDERKGDIIFFKDIHLDTKQRKVFIENKEIELTRLEFELLHIFLTNKNIVLKRDFLLEKVWKDDILYQEKTVNVAVNRLKKRIDPDKSKGYIESIWGVGYKLC